MRALVVSPFVSQRLRPVLGAANTQDLEFLKNGLNIVEPLDRRDSGDAGTVINVASWTDSEATSLSPHEPEPTEVVVEFAPEDQGSGEVH